MDKTYRKPLSLESLPRMRKQNASLKVACKSTELIHLYNRFVDVCKCGEQNNIAIRFNAVTIHELIEFECLGIWSYGGAYVTT